ncbi:uncharacterized protein CLUP02_07515 [Colletotrichum lupini]|uniref:Ankyrin repeat-containing protein YAR1 n=1 Tax=Colletotrichum lupini TaxID=145971 RepID=A0A9Q8WG15_9PEZI|nr:uncharacterized protein CLUP02_07515 [Colletotrichum lupini]UQC82029.1 hypothetical protein CLUP02_07515 [Colletotrichum lupini]
MSIEEEEEPCGVRTRASNTVPPHTSPENFYLTFKTHFRSSDSIYKISPKMAPKLSEEEIDDLIYFSRAGELADLKESLKSLSEREGATVGEIITAAKDEGKSTCLHMAAGNGHLDIVKALVTAFDSRPAEEKKAYVDAGNEFGNTGLHWACLGGHLEAVKYLVSHGASPAVANDKDQIPLDSALFNDKREVADWFLAQSEKMEGGNQEEGLSGAASGIEIEDDGAVEEDKGKDKAGESSKSS